MKPGPRPTLPYSREVIQKFHTHKATAKRRSIEFLFTRDEWFAWWEKELGPDWYNLRGKHGGSYVMARKGDTGPYAPGNVECLLTEDNNRAAIRFFDRRTGRFAPTRGCASTREDTIERVNAGNSGTQGARRR